MSVDVEVLTKSYYYFDAPVPYKLLGNTTLTITPISVRQSSLFLGSVDILLIDKNSAPDAEVIGMSYLQFLATRVLPFDKLAQIKLSNLLYLCLGINEAGTIKGQDGKYRLHLKDLHIDVNGKQFDDIKQIILTQNLINYKDEYINPELQEDMNEVDAYRHQDEEIPTLERQMAIVTAHCGVLKSSQMDMTYRSFSQLFTEVAGEVEFTTIRPIALFGGKANEVEHWIYKKKRNRFESYVTDVSDYNKQMGGNGVVPIVTKP